MVEDAATHLREGFNVPVVLVWIDTVIAAAQYAKTGDDNDTAIGQKIMSVLAQLSRLTDALVVGIDHFGKMVETGTRGASSKEGHADSVLAALAEREVSGGISNTRLAIRKQRDGVAGTEIPFSPEVVQVGTDEDREPITRVIINWEKQPVARAADASWSKSLRLLRLVLMTMLADVGFEAIPFIDGPAVRAVKLDLVRNEFYRQYPADGDERQKAEARRQAFYRSVKDAQAKKLVMTREVEGVQLIWLTRERKPHEQEKHADC